MPNEPVRERRRQDVADSEPIEGWIDRELAGCQFKDERLGKRFRTLLEQLPSVSQSLRDADALEPSGYD
jgi:hypothetical protein